MRSPPPGSTATSALFGGGMTQAPDNFLGGVPRDCYDIMSRLNGAKYPPRIPA